MRSPPRDFIEEDKGVAEEFEPLEETLHEARRRYDKEENRRTTVENKTRTVVTVNALIISFGSVFPSTGLFLNLVTFLPAVISAGLGLYGIRSRIYEKPGVDIEDFHNYSSFKTQELQEKFLLDYEICVSNNMNTNDKKFTIFNYCIGLTFTSLVLVLLAPIASRVLGEGLIQELLTNCPIAFGGGTLVISLLLPIVLIYLTIEKDRPNPS